MPFSLQLLIRACYHSNRNETRTALKVFIQSRLVLEAVVAAEGITASEEEFEEEVKTMAEVYQETPDVCVLRFA